MPVVEKHQGGRIGPRRWLHVSAAPAILLAITVGFFWRLVLTDQYTWLESPDIANQVLPWFQYQAGEWHQGRFPMWDPHHGTGQSLIGQAQPGAAYPLNWILFSLPLKDGWIRQVYLHWYFVLTRWLAALFCYWLCRDLKRSRAASALAGVVFSLGGYVGFTDWPQMVNGAIWAPLVFLFVLRALRGRNPVGSAALGGMFLGVSWLSGHHQVPIFLSLVLTGLWGYQAVRGGRLRWAVVRAASWFYVFAGLTSALQVLPAIEYGQRALRWVNLPDPVSWKEPIPYTVHTSFSMEAIDLLGLVLPGVCRHAEILVGVLAVALTVAALWLGLRSPAVRWFAWIGAAGMALALGGSSVVHGVLYAVVPMVEKARVPLAAVVILHFSVAFLSAWGLDHLCSRWKTGNVGRFAGALAVAGAVLWVVVAAVWVIKDGARADKLAFPALVLVVGAAVFWARRRGWITGFSAAAACLVLVVMELGSARVGQFPHRGDADRNRYLSKMAQSCDLMRFIRTHKWPVRIDVDEQKMGFNVGDWHGIDVLTSSAPSLARNFVALGPEGERTHMLLGVNYQLGTAPRWPSQQLVFKGADGVNLYQNPGALPRVWAVHEVVRLERPEEVGTRLSDRGFDLARVAFVVSEAVPVLELAAGSDSVRLVRREPHGVRMEAEMGSKGMVVLSDAFYPGWRASLDGRPVEIHEVYGGLRGVVTPAGRHVIEMRYRPGSVFVGGALTALGVLGACGVAVAGRRRRLKP